MLHLLLVMAMAGSGAGTLASGTWGGPHLRLTVDEHGVGLEFDCARGTIAKAPALDAQGRFDVEGRFLREHGGPVQKDEDATAAGFDGLKGHRSVGGLRASLYNAFPEEGVQALVQFMQEFETKNG